MDTLVSFLSENLTTIISSIVSFLVGSGITYSITRKMNIGSLGSSNTTTQRHSGTGDNIGRDKNTNN